MKWRRGGIEEGLSGKIRKERRHKTVGASGCIPFGRGGVGWGLLGHLGRGKMELQSSVGSCGDFKWRATLSVSLILCV